MDAGNTKHKHTFIYNNLLNCLQNTGMYIAEHWYMAHWKCYPAYSPVTHAFSSIKVSSQHVEFFGASPCCMAIVLKRHHLDVVDACEHILSFSRCTPLYVLDLGRQMPASARVERHMSNRVRKQGGETQSIAHGEGVTLAVHVRDMCVDDAMLEVHAVKKGRVREAPPGTAGACARLSRQLQVDTVEPWARKSVFSILAMMDRYRQWQWNASKSCTACY